MAVGAVQKEVEGAGRMAGAVGHPWVLLGASGHGYYRHCGYDYRLRMLLVFY